MHKNTQFNTHKFKMCICTPSMLQISKPPNTIQCQNVYQSTSYTKHPKGSSKHLNYSRSTPLPINSQISNSITCMSGHVLYSSTIELKIKSHKHIHIHIIRIVAWSFTLIVLPFIAFSLIGSYNQYGMSQIPLPTNCVGLFKSYSFVYFYPLHLYDYEQFNALIFNT